MPIITQTGSSFTGTLIWEFPRPEHPEVFGDVKSESEGKKLLQAAWQHFKRKKQLYRFPGFLVQCCFKYAGYLLGKHYRLLPKKAVLALTDNREYWRQNKD